MERASRYFILINVAVGAIGIGIGVIIGYFSNTTDEKPWVATVEKQLEDIDENTIPTFISKISSANIRSNLQYLAEQPHMATTQRDKDLVQEIHRRWTNQLDESEIVTHTILLSFPSDDPDKKNEAVATDKDGNEILRTKTTELVYSDVMSNSDKIVQYYNAFSPKGTVEGKLVYANFGSDDDFKYLVDQGIDLNGTIALTKYGRVGRGTRTYNAKPYGVIGVLVYSDPENYVSEGEVGYPDDWSLPPTGVQRGSTMSEFGDPTTPLFPSIKSAYRIPEEEIPYFPVLPLQPIAYEDAGELIRLMNNDIPPGPDWSTGLNSKNLKIGPGFAAGGNITLSVYNELRYVESENVIGTIRGSTESDSWVMYGNHRDSWVYGAVDPSSGTACMLEITRSLGEMLQSGWRPKRTMKFGSWGAEEFGLIGSTEWAQENERILSERAVAYVNVDIAVFSNQTFNAGASHIMKNLLIKAASKVTDPVDESKTVLDTWIDFMPGDTDSEPNVKNLGSGSDYAYFFHALGITASDLSYRGDPSNPRYRISPYPVYHTAYDTFDYVDRFVDPGFIAHNTVTKVAGSAILLLADSLIIPFDSRDIAAFVKKQIDGTVTSYGAIFDQSSLDYLKEAGEALTKAAADLHSYIDNTLDRQNPAKIAAVNERLRLLERSFIEPAALPNEINFKHVSGSPGSVSSFPSIDRLLYGVAAPDDSTQLLAKQQLAMITYRINNAASFLLIK